MESMDYIEPDVTENYKYLQEHNTSTLEQLAQQPPQFQPAEQPAQRPRREVVPKVPPQEPPGTTTKALPLRPPPGLEQVPPQPAAPPDLGTTSKAPPVKAPSMAPPPKPAQPQPVAGPQQHRPVASTTTVLDLSKQEQFYSKQQTLPTLRLIHTIATT